MISFYDIIVKAPKRLAATFSNAVQTGGCVEHLGQFFHKLGRTGGVWLTQREASGEEYLRQSGYQANLPLFGRYTMIIVYNILSSSVIAGQVE